jgi:hypothetical protein
MHGHVNFKFIAMHGHVNVKFIAMHGHANVKFIAMHGHVNVKLNKYSHSNRACSIRIYRSIILPVVLYGCETWSLTLKEERRLRVFENRVLRSIFGPKRDEVTGNGENYIIRS